MSGNIIRNGRRISMFHVKHLQLYTVRMMSFKAGPASVNSRNGKNSGVDFMVDAIFSESDPSQHVRGSVRKIWRCVYGRRSKSSRKLLWMAISQTHPPSQYMLGQDGLLKSPPRRMAGKASIDEAHGESCRCFQTENTYSMCHRPSPEMPGEPCDAARNCADRSPSKFASGNASANLTLPKYSLNMPGRPSTTTLRRMRPQIPHSHSARRKDMADHTRRFQRTVLPER